MARGNRLLRFAVMSRIALCSALAWVGTLRGQVVAWDVNGQNASANNPLVASILDSRFSAANLTLGAGLGASSATNTFGGSGFDQTSLAGAITAGDYLSLSLTPASGNTFSLSSMSLLFGVSTAVTNFNVALTSSASGFAAANALWSFAFNTTAPAAQTITLSSFPTLQDIASVVEFRLYGWRDVAGTTTFRIRDNSGSDLAFSGAVSAIPEPSAYAALVGAVGLVFATRARWKRRRRLTE